MNPDYFVSFIAGVLITIIVFVFSQAFKAWYDDKINQIRKLEEEYFSWKKKIREVQDVWLEFERWKYSKENNDNRT